MILFTAIILLPIVGCTPAICSIDQAKQDYSTQLSGSDIALLFLSDVVQLETSKYNLTLISNYKSPDQNIYDEEVTYRAVSVSGSMDIAFHLRNNRVVWCKFFSIKGTPYFSKRWDNALDSAKDFLSKYKATSQLAHAQEISDILNDISKLENLTQIINNTKCELSTADDKKSASFGWYHTIPGYDSVEYSGVLLTYKRGVFESFSDEWDHYPVGNTDVRFTQVDAARIAKEAVTSGSNYTVSDKFEPYAALYMVLRGDKQYPQWYLLVPLDRVYEYGVTSVQMTLWADTGEISAFNPTGSLGLPPITDETASPSLTPTTSTPPTSTSAPPQPSATPAPVTPAPSASESPMATSSPFVSPAPTISPPSPLSSTKLAASPSLQSFYSEEDNRLRQTASGSFIIFICVVLTAVMSLLIISRRKLK